MIELFGLRPQARLDVAQALPLGQLGEGHAQEFLIQATEAPDVEIPAIFACQTPKCVPGSELQQLCEHQLASMHRPLPARCGQVAGLGAWRSNR